MGVISLFSARASMLVTVLALGVSTTPVLAQAQQNVSEDAVLAALEKLPGYIASTQQRSGVPGIAVAVVHNNKTLFAKGFGIRKKGEPGAVDEHTVFQLASLSKPISATIAATQITQGKLGWHDPVSDYLPDFALASAYVTRQATIGDLMAHRSGLPAAAGDELEDIGFSRAQIIARLQQQPLTAFRLSHAYANFSTTTAAEAVAAAANTSWEQLAEASLFQPLGMTRTSARYQDYLAHDNRASLHAFENEQFLPLYQRTPDAQSPAGGVSSSVADLALWLKLLLNTGKGESALLTQAALLPAMSPQTLHKPLPSLLKPPSFYGYGFNVGFDEAGDLRLGHSGAFLLGASTAFQLWPAADIGMVVLTNGGPVGVPESLIADFTDTVRYGSPQRDWYAAYREPMKTLYQPVGDLAGQQAPASPTPAQANESYTGEYKSTYFGPAVITQQQGALLLTLGPARVPLPLTHWSGNTFAIEPNNENAPAGSRSSVHFTVENGKATGFTIAYLDQHGLARWQR
ncbi:serine hydrolase [Oceanimonas sp. AH20CE76]|uniref:serine hydrolase n=1 Tax=Oceanimonas sp. AH20CE76 TaxID=2977120 RepID=UPI0031FE6D83